MINGITHCCLTTFYKLEFIFNLPANLNIIQNTNNIIQNANISLLYWQSSMSVKRKWHKQMTYLVVSKKINNK